MPETLSDTGPILHQEIGRLPFLTTVSPLNIPELVQVELGSSASSWNRKEQP